MPETSQPIRPNGKCTRFEKMIAKCEELGIPISHRRRVMKARIESFERYGNLDNHVDPIMKSKIHKRREKREVEQGRQAKLKVVDLYAPLGQSRLVLRANHLITTRDCNKMDLDGPPLIGNQVEDMDSSDDSSDEDETDDEDDLGEAKPNNAEAFGTENYGVENFFLLPCPLHGSSATKLPQNESRLQSEYQTEQAHSYGDGIEDSNNSDQKLAPIKSSAAHWYKTALYNLNKPKEDTYLRSVAEEKKYIEVYDLTKDELLHVCRVLGLKTKENSIVLADQIRNYQKVDSVKLDFRDILNREPPPNKHQSSNTTVSQQSFKPINMGKLDSSSINNAEIQGSFRSHGESSISHLLIKAQKPRKQIPVFTELELAHICKVLKLNATGKESKLRNRIQNYQFQTKASVNFSEILKTPLPRQRDPENTSQSLNGTVPQKPIQVIDAFLINKLVSSEQHVASVEDKFRSNNLCGPNLPVKATKPVQVKLSNLTIFELQYICTSLNLKKNGQEAKLIGRIQNYENNNLKRPANISEILKTLPRATEPEHKSQLHIGSISQQSLAVFPGPDNEPNTERDDKKITENSMAELIHICLVLGLEASGKKATLVKKIMEYQERLGAQLNLFNILNIKVRSKKQRRQLSSATESQSKIAPVPQKPLPAFETLNFNQQNMSEHSYYGQAHTQEGKGYGRERSFEGIANVSRMETEQAEPENMTANNSQLPWQSPTYIEIGHDAAATNPAPTQAGHTEFIANKCGHLADHEVGHLCRLYGLDTGGCHRTRARQLEDFQRLNKRLINFEVALKYLPTPGQPRFPGQKLKKKRKKLLPCKRCKEMNTQCKGQLPCKNCVDQGFGSYNCVRGDPQDGEEQAGAGAVEVQGSTTQFFSDMHDQGFDDDMECEN